MDNAAHPGAVGDRLAPANRIDAGLVRIETFRLAQCWVVDQDGEQDVARRIRKRGIDRAKRRAGLVGIGVCVEDELHRIAFSHWLQCGASLREITPRHKPGSREPRSAPYVLTQRLARVVGAVQPTPLQFGNHRLDELHVGAGRDRRADHEAVAAARFEHVLQLVGNGLRRPDQHRRELTDPVTVARFTQGQARGATALQHHVQNPARPFGDVHIIQRLVQRELRQIDANCVRDVADTDLRADQAIQVVGALARDLIGLTQNDVDRRRNDAFLRGAAVARHPRLDVSVERLHVGLRMLQGEHDLGPARGELPATFG